MLRHLHERHSLYHMRESNIEDPEEKTRAMLQDWICGVGCASHDAQNALSWGVTELLSDPVKGLKDLFLVIESCRNGADLIHHQMLHLAATATFTTPRADDLKITQLWATMGVESSRLDLVVEVNPWWIGTSLSVSPHLEFREDGQEMITEALWVLYRFTKFSSSRTRAMGDSTRGLTCARACGLEHVVKTILTKGKRHDYLRGYNKLSEELKTFSVVNSVASYVADSFHLLLEEDAHSVSGRLVRREPCPRNFSGWKVWMISPGKDSLLWLAMEWIRLPSALES